MPTGTVSPGKALTKKLPQRVAAKAKACSRWGPKTGSLKPTPGASSTSNVTCTGAAWLPGTPNTGTPRARATPTIRPRRTEAIRCRRVSWRRGAPECARNQRKVISLPLFRECTPNGTPWQRATCRSDQRRRSAAAESLAQLLTLGLPPLVQDGDVGADGEVPDTHVEEVLRLIRGGDLGAGRHAQLDRRFEHATLHDAELRGVALAGPSDAHRVVGAAPLHHVDTFDGQDFLERVDRSRLFDHDGHDDVAQGLDILLGAAVAHVGESTGGHSVGSSVLRGLRAHDAHALLHVDRGATVGKQDAVEAGSDRPLREEAPRLLVDLELHRHAVDVRGSGEVVEVVEVEGAVLAHELDVVVETRVPDGFHDGRPRGVNVSRQRGPVGLQELAQLVGSHVVSPIVSIPASHRQPGPLPVRGRRPSARGALP